MSSYQILCVSGSVFFAVIAWLPAQDPTGIRIANAINLSGAVLFAYIAGLPVS